MERRAREPKRTRKTFRQCWRAGASPTRERPRKTSRWTVPSGRGDWLVRAEEPPAPRPRVGTPRAILVSHLDLRVAPACNERGGQSVQQAVETDRRSASAAPQESPGRESTKNCDPGKNGTRRPPKIVRMWSWQFDPPPGQARKSSHRNEIASSVQPPRMLLFRLSANPRAARNKDASKNRTPVKLGVPTRRD
jgi:hypothetical protein